MGLFDVNNYIDPTWSTSIFDEEEKNQNEAELNKTRVEFIIEEYTLEVDKILIFFLSQLDFIPYCSLT